MKKHLSIILIIAVMFCSLANTAKAENKKLAQTGFKFLSVSTDARASALSGALTSLEGNSTAIFYNPAGMADMQHNLHVALGQVRWIADIDYLFGSLAYSPALGQYGVFALSLLSVDYGEFQNTILANNEQGFLDLESFNPTAYAFGIGYAKSLTNKFRIGAQIKYVQQNLGGGIVDFESDQSIEAKNFAVDVLAFDFGLIYRTGFKSLNFGMNIRNFSEEIEYIKESFQLPLIFEMGISMNVIDLTSINPEQHALFLSVDALHPRDFEEQIDLGLEYIFAKTFALRTGYTTPTDEQGMSFGAGFNQKLKNVGLGIDYCFTPFGLFENVHRFSIQFYF